MWHSLLISISCKSCSPFEERQTNSNSCGDSILINGKGSVNCPGIPFIMSLVPPPVLPLLMGENLTDKGCLPLSNVLAQTTYPHDLTKVPPGMFEGCNATKANQAVVKVDPHQGWASLNFISTASVQELVGETKLQPIPQFLCLPGT